MTFDVQNLLVLLAVAAAGGYLARMAWQTMSLRRAGACGSCSNCATGGETSERNGDAPQVISLDALRTGSSQAVD